LEGRSLGLEGRRKAAARTLEDDSGCNDLVDRLRLIRSENVGPITYRALLARFGTATRALNALAALSERGGRRTPLRITGEKEAVEELKEARAAGMQPVVLGTPRYPSLLSETGDAPPILFAKGKSALLQTDSVAIVGARNASAVGMRFAHDLAGGLGEAGLVVVSGLARGIDTAAHRGALNSGTTAVMAGGLDYVYPPENDGLYAEICQTGCALSEMPPGVVPKARHFPRRNRIVAGIARAVVVVEGAARSGSLITARLANEQGRDVLAVPGSPLDPRARGPNGLIRDGAAICEGVDDVLAALELPRHSLGEVGPSSLDTDLEENHSDAAEARQALLERLSFTPTDIDDLIRLCSISPSLANTAILELELAGRAQRLPGHRVQLMG
jgi:DNA processing protein